MGIKDFENFRIYLILSIILLWFLIIIKIYSFIYFKLVLEDNPPFLKVDIAKLW